MLDGGEAMAIPARERGGSYQIICNVYRLGGEGRVKPCEIAMARAMTFSEGFGPLG